MANKKTACAPHLVCLKSEERSRYLEKIAAICGIDPYDIPDKSWSVDKNDLPADFNFASIVNYFVLAKSSYTAEHMRAYKSLTAYGHYVSGWVRDIKIHQPNSCDNNVITAKVSIISFCTTPSLANYTRLLNKMKTETKGGEATHLLAWHM